MASDLIVAAIHIPPTVVAGCPTSILVDIKNVGSDAAPLPFQVCLEISVWVEGRPNLHRVVVLRKIEGDLQPGAMIQALFKNVRFPCAPKAFVTATADCG